MSPQNYRALPYDQYMAYKASKVIGYLEQGWSITYAMGMARVRSNGEYKAVIKRVQDHPRFKESKTWATVRNMGFAEAQLYLKGVR